MKYKSNRIIHPPEHFMMCVVLVECNSFPHSSCESSHISSMPTTDPTAVLPGLHQQPVRLPQGSCMEFEVSGCARDEVENVQVGWEQWVARKGNHSKQGGAAAIDGLTLTH